MEFSKNSILRICIALVWFINGFFCKLLNLVPRHQLIVGQILGTKHAFLFTKFIGLSEIVISLWVVSRLKSRICTWVQVVLILIMNIIEFIKVPDLLLFGHGNVILALVLIFAILFNEYFAGQKSSVQLKGADV